MKALILAAGVGKRLGASYGGLPKCLIPIGGRPLLLRMLTSLKKEGVSERVVVVGYEKDRVQEAVRRGAGENQDIRFRLNPDYTKGSILSLWAAREEFDDDLLIMDADVLFSHALLARLIRSPHANALLLDPRSASTGEEMMLMVREGRVLRIGRRVEGRYDLVGEGVGFLKVSRGDAPLLKGILEEMVGSGRDQCEYEEALDRFLRETIVGYELAGDLPWTEIDFPEDVERAAREVLPRL